MNRNSSTTWWILPLAVITLVCLLVMGQRVRGIAVATLYLSVAATAVAIVPGVLAAVTLTKTACLLRRWMLAAFAVMLFAPLFVHAGGWMGALGVGGWLVPVSQSGQTEARLDGWSGAIWIHAMAAVPWIVCIVSAALARVPVELEEAALLTMPAWRVLCSVTLRAALPGIAIAAVWTAVSIASEMTVTDFFQIRTFAEEVYTTAASGGFPTDQVALDKANAPTTPDAAKDSLADELAWAWSHYAGLVGGVVLLAVTMLWVLVPVAQSLATHADSSAERSWQWRPAKGRWLLFLVPASVLLLVAAMPIAALFYKAGLGAVETTAGWQRAWQPGKLTEELTGAVGHHWRELLQTLGLGAAVATTSTLVAAVLGWHLRTCRRTPWLLLALFALAMSIPGPILGLVAIKLLNHPLDSPLALLTWAYDRTLFAPWLVQTIRFTPIASLVMAAGFATVPRLQIDAAQTDGAGWLARFWQIGVLQVRPQVLSTWLAAFALSAGELSASILVMPPGPPTLTIRLFGLLHYGVEDRVSAMSLVLLAAVALVAAVAVWLVGYGRRGADGRV